jgi:hypothetical protein
MQQTKKLQTYMSPSNTGQQQIELVKASQCLSELGTDLFHSHHFIFEILLQIILPWTLILPVLM